MLFRIQLPIIVMSRSTALLLVGVFGVSCGGGDAPERDSDDHADAQDAATLDAGNTELRDAAGATGSAGSDDVRDTGATDRMGATIRDAGGASSTYDAGSAARDGGTGSARDGGGSAAPDGGASFLRRATGFASLSSAGLATTTGGGTSAPDIATSCSALKAWLEDATPRVVELPAGSTLDCRTNLRTIQACELKCSSGSAKVFWRVPVADQSCSSLADFNGDGTLEVPAGVLVNKQRSDFTIRLKSNKTLRGAGSGATLLGVSLDIDTQSNIIIQNVAIREINPSLIEAGDAITINRSHHVWVDHCAFSQISDGYMDVRYGSNNVTVSYNQIDGKNSYVCDGQHNFVSLVSDSSVTFDHNFFDHAGGRNPKVTGASQVHLYSNGYEGVSYFCASAGAGAELLVENNYYSNSRYPHWAEGGELEASGNQYVGSTSSTGRDSNADVFAPPYPYTLVPASSLGSTLRAEVGPHAL